MGYNCPREVKWRVKKPAFLCVILATFLGPVAARGTIELTVTQAGFPTMTAGPVVRNGAWMPVIVDLDLINQQAFDGALRVAQFDNDGDECFDRVEVHLRADTGGSKRFILFVPANPKHGQGRLVVELRNDEGGAAEVLTQGELTYRASPIQQPTVIPDDHILILSVSPGTIGRVQDLVAMNKAGAYARPINVGHLSPTELPELWIGLEAVDYIVWDDAHPEDLTERQLGALLDWVRRGGTLLIAASRSAGSLTLTKPLNAVLPVEVGEIVSVDKLREVRSKLLAPPVDDRGREVSSAEWLDVDFRVRVEVARCTLREAATAVAYEEAIDSPVVTRRREGLGYVVFSAVTLKDLFSAPGDAAKFFEKLFYLVRWDNPEAGQADPVPLFPKVVSAISFAGKGGLYLFVAGISSVAYLVLATFASWSLLTRKGWRHFSWNAFALVAIAASVISVLLVRSKQGFGETLHQVSIVDLEGGSLVGHATALFGLKTSVDKELDVWLPADRLGDTEPGSTKCYLRPLPGAHVLAEAGAGFADPGEYRVVPGSAVVDNVRIRATLKQFEGYWSGLLEGELSGEVFTRGREIAEGSYIINDLGVELKDCWLLHALFDADEVSGFRRDSIYAYDLGQLPADGARIPLRPLCYPLAPGQEMGDLLRNSTLDKRQTDWGSTFRAYLESVGLGGGSSAGAPLGAERKALLLLSTVGDFDPLRDTNMGAAIWGARTWSRDRLRRLDLRDQLQSDRVILIGFAEDPGPVQLSRRTGERPYRPLKAERGRSLTMYRIRLAVTSLGGRREPSETEDEGLLGMEEESLGLDNG